MRAATLGQDKAPMSWANRLLRAIAKFEEAVLRDSADGYFEQVDVRLARLEAVVFEGHTTDSALSRREVG